MLYNYVKIAFRTLVRHKSFSFINIFGLAIGMSCSILILLWVQDELSYDKFHPHAKNTYRIISSLPELAVDAAVSSAPMAAALQAEIPAIRKAIRTTSLHSALLQVGDRMFEEKRMLYVDTGFFELFSFPLVAGNPTTALHQEDGILITEAMAKKYFGDESALGKIIQRNHKDDLVVTGVMKDIPDNTHLKFDFIQPMAFLARSNRDLKEQIWDNFNFYTYAQLNGDTSPAGLTELENRINEIYKANESNLRVAFHLQPLTDIHLHSGSLLADISGHGNIQYVYILSVIAIFVLAVACINFMNLATARSARRAKEVGLRKVAGAVRSQLIRQFLAESSLIAFIALIFAIAIVIAVLPAFNELAGKNISIEFLDNDLLIQLAVLTLITGLLAGSYPALFLSGFLPAKVLKSNLKSGAGNSAFRNTMVVLQFVVSIVLLVGTAVVFNQLQFIKNRNLGFDKENLIYVPMTGELWSKYQAFRTTLEQNRFTNDYTFTSDLPTNLGSATIGVDWEGKDPTTQPLFYNLAVDENFIDVFQIKLLSGRSFSKEFRADTSNVIVNEKALEIIGVDKDEAIGKSFTLWGNKGVIIGVVKDFNFRPIQQPIEPMLLRLNTWGGLAVVRAKAGETETTIAELEKICNELNPGYPFTYNFFDQDLAKLYQSEEQLGNLFNVFAALAIFISCLGLYGLSAFLAERRTKEIGVRKALGATVFNIVYLLTRNFTRPILIAMVIATPIAWFAMNKWLEGFAYHVTIDAIIFVMAFSAALLIAWLTVSFESIKAALTNPTQSLRNE